ncbi:hypothetical protein JI666_03450 [Bacillus sp. NTK071]|uniref:S-Ena type endospore appendage n=1 Tax=Bacillus sp. NTK071 TaxID=2802175 RepID=UPI001A8D83C7|nr:S-Ena type endospore appendage [Bacillus sp. NTK071]MBN8207799.1 hypothetical protein [Bacillus sp. NTK071]
MARKRSLLSAGDLHYINEMDEREPEYGCGSGELIQECITGIFRIDPRKNPYAPIWEVEGCITPVFATLTIYYEKGSCEEIDVIVNCCDDTSFYVPLGNTRTRTYSDLCRVAIELRDGIQTNNGSVHEKPNQLKATQCVGKYCLNIYYYLNGKSC